MKRILTIGCSFTYGTELPDIPNHCDLTDPANQSRLSWPWQLAQRHAAQVTNLAISGGSNGRTFRVAMTESARMRYDLVVCQWTYIDRPDWQYNKLDMQTNPSRYNCELYPALGHYYTQHSNEDHSFQTWLSYIVALQNHFKSIDQSYVFVSVCQRNNLVNGTSRDGVIQQLENKYTDLIDQIDQQHFFGWNNDMGMQEWTYRCPRGPIGHPLESGHELVADLLDQHIVSKGLL
jgi:hypothetical protein